MGESGCLRDAKFNNLECNHLINHGAVTDRYADFLAGTSESIVNKTGATITQGNGVTGQSAGLHVGAAVHNLVANAINDIAITAAAATMIHLPDAVANTFVVAKISGDMDEANAFTISTAKSTDKIAKQVIGIVHSDDGGGDHGVTSHGVQTAGSHAIPTSVSLVYTPATGDTNCMNSGSEIRWYCARPGRWTVKIHAVSEGAGSTGVFTSPAA